jgi:hypothetical protein
MNHSNLSRLSMPFKKNLKKTRNSSGSLGSSFVSPGPGDSRPLSVHCRGFGLLTAAAQEDVAIIPSADGIIPSALRLCD